jgi:hypothetical protein
MANQSEPESTIPLAQDTGAPMNGGQSLRELPEIVLQPSKFCPPNPQNGNERTDGYYGRTE